MWRLHEGAGGLDKTCHHPAGAPYINELVSSSSIYNQAVEIPKGPQLQLGSVGAVLKNNSKRLDEVGTCRKFYDSPAGAPHVGQ